MMGLQLLNLFRWIREYFFSWGLLALIYSITATLILQSLIQNALKRDIPGRWVWASLVALLSAPAIVESIPFPPLPGPIARAVGMLSARVVPAGVARVYSLHDLRRGGTHLTIAVAAAISAAVPERLAALGILVAQLPIQRALFSLRHWRRIALASEPADAGKHLILAVTSSQLVQLLELSALTFLALAALNRPLTPWLALWPGLLGGWLASCSVCLEGDAARPWLVNFMSIAAGALGGYVCLAEPGFLLISVYVFSQMLGAAKNRLKSVENLDEDTLIP